MDKPSRFRHEGRNQTRELIACFRGHKESRTVSMAFSGSLTAFSGLAEHAPLRGKGGA
jgi:hypothetical protein